MNPGKRIAVVGVSAAGKSVFARKLASKLTLPLIHTDTVMWKPGWEYVGDETTVERLKEIGQNQEWIIEGFVEKGAFDAVLNNADSIVYLDYPRYIPAWRYITRWLKHRKDPRPELEGCPEKFSIEFLKRVWNKKEVYRLNKFLEKLEDQHKVIKLKSPKAADAFLRGV
jgi:adenylate kinase family enzyme